jgi:hypothetical protein
LAVYASGVLALLCLSAASASAQTVLVAPRMDDDEGRRIPWSVGFKLESMVGQGTFVADEYARNEQVGWGASVAPGYRPVDDLLLSAFAKVTQEVTDSDGDALRQQLQLLDVQLRSDYTLGTIPVLEVRVATGLWLALPTSRVSQFETLMLGTTARLVMGRRLGEHFSLDYLGTFRKNFHEYESPVLDSGTASTTPPVFIREGGAEDLPGTLVAVGTNNVSFSIYNLLALSWLPNKRWMLAIAYGMTNAFTYASFEKDALSSPYAQSGRGQRDATVGVIELGYQLDKRFMFSAGVQTVSMPKTEDNQSFRFPFYDFESEAQNQTSFYIDVTLNEAIGD